MMTVTKKIRIVAALCAICVICACVAMLSACRTAPDASKDGHVTLLPDGVRIEWGEVDGAERYAVYHSPSRFGEYELVQEGKSLSYTDADSYGYFRVDALASDGRTVSSELYSYDVETFGDNVRIYSPNDDMRSVQDDIDAFRHATSQFSDKRFAGLFKAGDYGELDLVMRYYMTFGGLGKSPEDTVLGKFNTYGELPGGNATCNFWCGTENLTVNSSVQWAVSQATSFRRMNVKGGMSLTDMTGNTAWGSGGFIADSVVSGTLNAGNQQQWLTRNTDWKKWTSGDINMVYAGCSGKLDRDYVWPNRRVTELETTTVMREKPYLVFDDGYYVVLPELRKNAKGVSWIANAPVDRIPLSQFYVARADRDDASSINAALQRGKHILFTPGIYNIDAPIIVDFPDTVVTGIGLATLKLGDADVDTIMRIADVDGVCVSGLIFDAGKYSKTLLEVGSEKTGVSHADNPVVLSDVYFRIGGAGSRETSVDCALVINSNDVVSDNFWVWRADHGNAGTVGWSVNKAKNGVKVYGDNVTVYGLMVEHFQEYQTVWYGENGFVAFYQSETPYDPPEYAEQDGSAFANKIWLSEWNGKIYEGYASYKVDDSVQKHTAYGLGVYYVASSGIKNVFNLDHAIELPSNADIRVEHMATANFLTYGNKTDNGGIRHIVNNRGDSLFVNNGTKRQFTSFIAGIYTE